MKKEILTLAAAALLTQPIFAQVAIESKTATDAPAKKIVLGAGWSDILLATTGYGANLKFDYLLTNKFSVGLKSVFAIRKKVYYTNPGSELVYPTKVDVNGGNIFNCMFASTYYIFGKNSNEGKGGFYTSLGMGYSASNRSETMASMAPVSDPLHYKYNVEDKNKNFSVLISLGGDRKLGPGRIYFEVPYTLDIFGTVETKFYNQEGVTNRVDQKEKGLREPRNTVNLFLNIGYHLYF